MKSWPLGCLSVQMACEVLFWLLEGLPSFPAPLSHSTHLIFLTFPSNIQGQVKSEEGPEWNILRDDFMMGASMKDWDKESDGESSAEQGGGLKQEDDSD